MNETISREAREALHLNGKMNELLRDNEKLRAENKRMIESIKVLQQELDDTHEHYTGYRDDE